MFKIRHLFHKLFVRFYVNFMNRTTSTALTFSYVLLAYTAFTNAGLTTRCRTKSLYKSMFVEGNGKDRKIALLSLCQGGGRHGKKTEKYHV